MFSAATKTDGASTAANYIEDVFSTWLYTGTGNPQTITNGIDLAGKGGMVWIKSRSTSTNNVLVDTARGVSNNLSSNLSSAARGAITITAFGATGFTVTNDGADAVYANTTGVNGTLYTSWTFREQPKFFDVVTYTGTGANQTIAHNLGSVPGCIFIKRRNAVGDWQVYHRSLANTQYLVLNTTAAAATGATRWDSTTPTDSVFSVGTDATVNASGGTYVAYLFAHDAGGFGASGSDNVISCGSYTGNGSATGPTVTLGYEPQWILIKNASGATDWLLFDSVRGIALGAFDPYVNPNLTAAETSSTNLLDLTSTGFQLTNTVNMINGSGSTYIYIAIRRGPMKTPTTGTSVFQPVVYTGTNVDNRLVNTGILTDFIMARQRNSTTVAGFIAGDRLHGNPYLSTGAASAAVNDPDSLMTPTTGYGNAFSAMNGFGVGNDATSQLNISTVASNQVVEAFARAPGFLDVVAYTGTGVARTINHNLGAVPQMMWVKSDSTATRDWAVYIANLGSSSSLNLNLTTAVTRNNTTRWNGTAPTSTVFSVGTNTETNTSGNTYVAYLMGNVPGVSLTSYYIGKGVGTVNQIDCGFSSGARYVLIKAINRASNWFVWDSARGIVAGNDPYIIANTTGAEVTSTDYVDTFAAGFELSTTATNDLNDGYANDWINPTVSSGTASDDIVFGGGKFVSALSSGSVEYSTDGYIYTTASTGLADANGLAFGNNLYVVVGTVGNLATSPDAITWTPRSSGVSVALNGAAYAFNKYWAVGNNGTLISSPDGTTWSTVSLGVTNNLLRIRSLNGNLVIVGANGRLITSSDGVTFTSQTSGVANDLRDATFNSGLYVVVGISGTIITSTDLTSWTIRNAGSLSTRDILSVTWASYRFVAGANGGNVGYSADGITWSAGASAGGSQLRGIAFGLDILTFASNALWNSDPRYLFWAIA